MRIAGPDVILFVVGLLLFAGASYAIYQEGGFSAQTSPLGVFTFAHATADERATDIDVDSYQSGSATFVLNQTDVSKVTVVVACTPATQAPATYEISVTVTPPPGSNLTEATGSGQCGADIAIEIPVTNVPTNGTVEGTTLEEAQANYRAANATLAQGEWEVAWSGSYATPAGPPIPNPIPVPPPGGSIGVDVERWTTTFTPVQGR